MPRDDREEPEYLRKIFIGNLSFNTSDDSLREFFSEFGEIVDSVVMKNKETGKSRGFGFVTYSESGMVDNVQSTRPHKVDGREVETKRVVPKDEVGKPESNMKVKKVFVGGIKYDMTEDDLREAFEKYGTITSASIPKDKATNKPRSFAFVDFEDHDSVDKVCLYKDIEVAGRRVNVRKAVDKEQMRNQEQRGGGGGGRDNRGGGGGYGGNQGGGNWGGNQGGGGGGGWGGNQGGGGGGGGWGGNQGGGGYGGNQGGGNWGGNQGGGGGWGGNQGGGGYGGNQGSGWGGNQGSGGYGGNQGGGNWGGNQGGGGYGGSQGGGWGGNSGGGGYSTSNSNQGPMRNTSNYSGNRSAPYSSGGGGGYGNRNY